MLVNEVFESILGLNLNHKTEFVGLNLALKRVLANDIKATKDLPAYDNSALDGYAFCYDDKDLALKIKGEIFAGDKNHYEISKGECYKIMTGAIFPKGADSVLRIEESTLDNNGNLIIPSNITPKDGKKLKGEEIKTGDVILKKGDILDAAKIMLLASQGICFVEVFCKPKIAVFGTGNELKEPWENCDEREIYNANSFGIVALLAQNGFDSEYKGTIKDEKNAILSEINSHKDYDLIITSGGASKGEADFMQEILLELGFSEIFSKINLRPAGPSKLYEKNGKFVSILPGNPMSCFVGCFFSVLPLVKKMSGFNECLPNKTKCELKSSIKFKSTRANIVLGTLKNGEFVVFNNGEYSPAMINPLAISGAFYLSNIGESEIESGSLIEVFEFDK